MNTIEDFFKNRIYFTQGEVPKTPTSQDNEIRYNDDWHCEVEKEIYPLKLNITNAIDLAERLTPLVYSLLSFLTSNNSFHPKTKITIEANVIH